MSSKPHWVTELFPPTFRFTLDELEKFPVREQPKHDSDKEDEDESKEGGASPKRGESRQLTELEKRLSYHIAPEDVGAIKNVYQRVWLMNRPKEKEPEQILDETGEALYKHASTCTSDLAAHWAEQADEDQEEIWSTTELSILRRVFRTAQQQNAVLSARVQAHDAEYGALKRKQRAAEAGRAEAEAHLHETRNANKRLGILNANLKATLDRTARKVRALEEDVAALKYDASEKSRRIHEQNVALDKERIERKKLEQDLRHKDGDVVSKLKLQEDKLDIIHQTEVKKLKGMIKKLQDALAEEIKEHDRTKKGLSVLRNHFTSLPYAGEEERKHMVSQDELVTWTT